MLCVNANGAERKQLSLCAASVKASGSCSCFCFWRRVGALSRWERECSHSRGAEVRIGGVSQVRARRLGVRFLGSAVRRLVNRFGVQGALSLLPYPFGLDAQVEQRLLVRADQS